MDNRYKFIDEDEVSFDNGKDDAVFMDRRSRKPKGKKVKKFRKFYDN